MSAWRSKVMHHPEWVEFQNNFVELWTALGADGRMALFMRGGPGDGENTLLIPGYNSELVERLSPGGWGDRQNPQEVNWTLLAGNSADNLGLTLGSD